MKHEHPARIRQQNLALRAKAGDRKAVEALAASMTFFVRAIANRMKSDLRGLQSDDLEQVGMIAVLRSLPTFDPDKGSFQNRAWQWALAAMEREIYDNLSLIKLPRGGDRTGAVAIVAKIKKSATDDTEALAKELGVSEKRVRNIHSLLRGHVSIDTGSDGNGLDLADDSDSPEDIAIRTEQATNVQKILACIQAQLTERETYILDNCVLADEEDRISVKEAGRMLGIASSTAYWTYNKLLSRLKQKIECHYREAA